MTQVIFQDLFPVDVSKEKSTEKNESCLKNNKCFVKNGECLTKAKALWDDELESDMAGKMIIIQNENVYFH